MMEAQKEVTAGVEKELEQCSMEKEEYFAMIQRDDQKIKRLN